MRLEDLYENFGTAAPEAQLAYVSLYRLRRAEDLAKPSTYRRKSTRTVQSKAALTEEEKLLCKLLGLKQKDILALRTAPTEEDEVTEELFDDGTFTGGEK